jgi:hypothetical protein
MVDLARLDNATLLIEDNCGRVTFSRYRRGAFAPEPALGDRVKRDLGPGPQIFRVSGHFPSPLFVVAHGKVTNGVAEWFGNAAGTFANAVPDGLGKLDLPVVDGFFFRNRDGDSNHPVRPEVPGLSNLPLRPAPYTGPPANGKCTTALSEYWEGTITKSGTVLAIGPLCTPDITAPSGIEPGRSAMSREAALEIWPKGSSRSTVTKLGKPAGFGGFSSLAATNDEPLVFLYAEEPMDGATTLLRVREGGRIETLPNPVEDFKPRSANALSPPWFGFVSFGSRLFFHTTQHGQTPRYLLSELVGGAWVARVVGRTSGKLSPSFLRERFTEAPDGSLWILFGSTALQWKAGSDLPEAVPVVPRGPAAEDYEDAEAVTVDPDGTLLVLVDDAGTWRVVALRR